MQWNCKAWFHIPEVTVNYSLVALAWLVCHSPNFLLLNFFTEKVLVLILR